MRKPDLGVILTKAFFAAVCVVTGWLLWVVGSTLARDIFEGDWSSAPILLTGLLLFGAPFAFGAYVLFARYLPRPKVTTANPEWMTEQLRALPFVTTAKATATTTTTTGIWHITVEPQPLTPAQTSTLLTTVWVESSIVPPEVRVLGRRIPRSELVRLFGEHPLSA